MSQTYTVKQVADILGYSTNSIYTFLKEERIKGIRVGRGRFRIPHAEVERLLQEGQGKGSVTTLEASSPPPRDASPVVATPKPVAQKKQSPAVAAAVGMAHSVRVGVPSIHDWFVGLSAITLGVSMVLFSGTMEEFAIASYAMWVVPIRTTLIAAGLGLLLTDVIGREGSRWHSFFHGILAIAFLGLSAVMFGVNDVAAAFIFGLLGLSLVGVMVLGLTGVGSFTLFVATSVVLSPLYLLVPGARGTLADAPLFQAVPMLAGLLFVVGASIAFGMWWGYRRSTSVYWIAMISGAAVFVGLSLWYAQNLMWGHALVILMMGLTSVLVPVWSTFEFAHKKDRRAVFKTFGSILFLFLGALVVVRVLVTNMTDYALGQLENKITFGIVSVERALENATTSLESAALNSAIVDGLGEDGDPNVLLGITRGLYEGNRDFQKVVTTDSTGTVVTAYPLNTNLEGKSLLSEDFVTRAITTEDTQMANLIDDQGPVQRPLVGVAVPVIVGENVGGTLVGYVDLEIIGNELQQVANAEGGEYFVVVDEQGKRVIHPDRLLVATAEDSGSGAKRGQRGEYGTGRAINYADAQVLHAYDEIDSTSWGISIETPITQALRSTNAASLVILLVSIGSALLMLFFVVSHRPKTTIPPGGPPG